MFIIDTNISESEYEFSDIAEYDSDKNCILECTKCFKEFNNKYLKNRHQKNCGSSRINCNICTKSFKTPQTYKQHLKSFHLTEKEQCMKCYKRFDAKYLKYQHQKICIIGPKQRRTRKETKPRITFIKRRKKKALKICDEIESQWYGILPDSIIASKYVQQKGYGTNANEVNRMMKILHSRDQITKLAKHRFNVNGAGRIINDQKKILFKKVTERFQKERYELGIDIKLGDIEDFLIEESTKLGMSYNEMQAENDSRAWMNLEGVKYYIPSKKIKFKNEYINNVAGRFLETLQKKMKEYRINHEYQIYSGDETNCQAGFKYTSQVLCYLKKNLPVYIIENEKDSWTTFIIFNSMMLSYFVTIFLH